MQRAFKEANVNKKFSRQKTKQFKNDSARSNIIKCLFIYYFHTNTFQTKLKKEVQMSINHILFSDFLLKLVNKEFFKQLQRTWFKNSLNYARKHEINIVFLCFRKHLPNLKIFRRSTFFDKQVLKQT